MKKINVFLAILTLILIPTMVYGYVGETEPFIPLGFAIFIEAFVTIHMSIFVLLPLSNIFSKGNSSKLFWRLFIIRIVILLFFDFFVTPVISIIDFLGVFVGAFLIVPISAFLKHKNYSDATTFQSVNTYRKISYYKAKDISDINEVIDNVANNNYENLEEIPLDSMSKNDTSPIVEIDREYLKDERVLIGDIIRKEIENQDEDSKKLTTPELNSSKNIAILFYGVLMSVFVMWHVYYKYPLYISIFFGIVATIAFIIIMSKYDIVNSIYNYCKKNPDSEIFQIVTSVKDRKKFGVIPDYIKIVTALCIAIFIPIIMFS